MKNINLKKIIANKPKILNLFQLGKGWAPQPLFYYIHLTLSCNARCYFCYQKKSDNFEAKNNDYLKAMKISDFENLLKWTNKNFFLKPRIHLFGGEPLFHPQFDKVIDLIEDHNFSYSITSNGILLGKYLDKLSYSKKLKQINISLYGIGAVHDAIVGHDGAFDDIINNIDRLCQNSQSRVIVNFNMLLLKENWRQCLELADFLSEKFSKGKIDALAFQYPTMLTDRPADKEVLELLGDLKRKKLNFEVLFLSERWPGYANYSHSMIESGNCNLPWLGLGILPNLDVLPAGSILTCSRVLGNLKKERLDEIWNGRTVRELRQQILKGLPISCRGCCHAQLPK